MKRQKSKPRPMRWLFGQVKSQLPLMAASAAGNVLLSATLVLFALACRGIVDGAVAHDRAMLLRYAAGLAALTLIQTVGRLLCRLLEERIRARAELSLKSRMFAVLLEKDYAGVTRYHSGELLNRLTSDVVVASDGATSLLPSLCALLTRLICAVCVLIAFDRNFTLIFLAAGVLVLLVSRIFRKTLKDLHKLMQEKNGRVRSFFQETLTNLAVVKVFDIQKDRVRRADALQRDHYQTRMKRRAVGAVAGAGFGLVFRAGYLFALLWGAFQIYADAMTFGSLTAVLQLVSQIQQPLSSLSGFLPRYYGVVASAERLMELEALPEERGGDRVRPAGELYAALREIRFEHLSFCYDRDPVFDDAELTLKKYDFAAIEGISGIGKSTLLKLLLGLYPDYGGRIYFSTDGLGEIPADRSTRRLFGYVPQGNDLFSGTVRENVALLRPDADDAQIAEALRVSCSAEFVDRLPQGLDTVIGEKGAGLSEGQAQRLAIARMLLGGAPVLLLDEATSALDEETEERLLRNLKALRGYTLIIVSHKKAALKICGKIIRIAGQKITVTAEEPERSGAPD